MGNWDNLYYEIHDEITLMGLQKEFSNLVNQLSCEEKYKHQPVRARWSAALQMIQNNEY